MSKRIWSEAKLAVDIRREKDAALAEPLADGLIAHVRAERDSKKSSQGRGSPRSEVWELRAEGFSN